MVSSLTASCFFWMIFRTGFYFHPSVISPSSNDLPNERPSSLLLGPFHGRPACQSIALSHHTRKNLGVCADSYLKQETLVVQDVEKYPGHIACDGETKSEIVLPITVDGANVGVLDLDCEIEGAWDEDDKAGLEEVVRIFVRNCEWQARS